MSKDGDENFFNINEIYIPRKENSLESLISMTNLSSIRKNTKEESIFIPNTSMLEPQYAALWQTATTVDDFTVVFEKCKAVYQLACMWGEREEAKKHIRDAMKAFVDTQKQVAVAFAMAGDYETAIEYVQRCGVKIEGGEIPFDYSISQEERHQIVDIALMKARIGGIVAKVAAASQLGDFEETKRLAALATRAYILQRKLGDVDNPLVIRKDDEGLHKLSEMLTKMHMKAYSMAVAQRLVKGIGIALDAPRASVATLDSTLEEIKALLLDEVEHFIKPAHCSGEYGKVVDSFNWFWHPLFRQLSECMKDPNHPLRRVYQPAKQSKQVVGFERIPVEEKMPVPMSFYERFFASTGVPMVVDSIFMRVYRAYHVYASAPHGNENA